MAGWAMGLDGWTENFHRALAMARTTDPVSQATIVVVERSSEDIAVVLVRLALGTALICHDGGDRQRGFKVMAELRDMCAKQRYALNAVPYFDVCAAREKSHARRPRRCRTTIAHHH